MKISSLFGARALKRLCHSAVSQVAPGWPNSTAAKFTVIALGCWLPLAVQAHTFGWTGGSLSDFLAEFAEQGLSLPLTDPFEIAIDNSGSVLVDVDLQSDSIITAIRGQIGVDEGRAISNTSTAEFILSGASQIFARGDPALAIFENEGIVRHVAERSTTISTSFVNFNGGTVHADEGSTLRLTLADIRTNSLFSGTGLVRVGGQMSGEIHSEQSLVLGSGVGDGLTTGEEVIVSGNWRWSGPLKGTWTNLGVVAGNPVNDGALGELRSGAEFVNDGTVIGRFMRLAGNEEDLAPDQRTRFVNNGVIELAGTLQGTVASDTKFITTGDAPSELVNNGVLKITGHSAFSSQVVLGDILFENNGTIDVADGVLFDIGSVGKPFSNLSGGVFRSGSSFTGAGTTRLTGNSLTRHEFYGAIISENLQFFGFNGTAFNGNGATLLGTATWISGALTGSWLNFSTLTIRSSAPVPVLSGTLSNSGSVQQRNSLRLAPAATIMNLGVYALTGGANNDLLGTAESTLDQFVNLGQFYTSDSLVNVLEYLHFDNQGLMRINSRTILHDTVLENHGTIMGNGTLAIDSASTFLNEGTIAPGLSPGTLNISGNFTNGDNAVIEIEMASATVFDVLRVTGTVNLGGTLRIKLLDGFRPNLNTNFNFLRYSAFTGAFDDIVLDGFSGAEFSFTYGTSGFGLAFVAIPEPVPLPPAWLLLASALAAMTRISGHKRSIGIAPCLFTFKSVWCRK